MMVCEVLIVLKLIEVWFCVGRVGELTLDVAGLGRDVGLICDERWPAWFDLWGWMDGLDE